MKKRIFSFVLCGAMLLSLLAGCCGGGNQAPAPAPAAPVQSPAAEGSAPPAESAPTEPSRELSEVEKIIAEADTMSFEDLCKKAIEESNGKTLYGVGNSSRGKTAGTSFIELLQSMDSSYTGTIGWSQPKNNSIFTMLNADVNSSTHTYSMTLIQDGNQIQSKMLDTGNLLNFIPNYRMHRAIDFLKDCRNKVYEVAEKVGYRDHTYFSSTFKRLVGISPSDYQRRCK